MKLSDSHLGTSAILSRVAARKLVQVELRPLAATMERWYDSQRGATRTTHRSLIRVCSNKSKYYIQTMKDTKTLGIVHHNSAAKRDTDLPTSHKHDFD